MLKNDFNFALVLWTSEPKGAIKIPEDSSPGPHKALKLKIVVVHSLKISDLLSEDQLL